MIDKLTEKEKEILKKFEDRFGKIDTKEDIKLFSAGINILKKINKENKKATNKQNITSSIYTDDTLAVISNFESEYGEMIDINYYLSLLELHSAFIVENKVFYEETEDGLEPSNLYDIFKNNRYINLAKKLNLLPDEAPEERDNAFNSLIDVLAAIEELGKITNEKIFKENFDVTIAEIASMLQLTEGYITRNLMGEFVNFNMSQYARFYIKSINPKIDMDFINKKVFISRVSYDDFIKTKIKFTDFKKQILLDFDYNEYKNFYLKFKEEKDRKKAINKAIKILDREYVQSPPKRKDQAKYPLSEELLNKIYSEDYKMMSMKSLREYYEKEARDNLENREDYEEKEYKFVSYNDYQVYYNKLNKMTFARLVVDDVKSESSQHGTQNKTIVRYLVPTSMIGSSAQPLQETDNCYSLFNVTYKSIIANMPENIEKTDEAINTEIRKKIYNIMIDDNFKI